MQDIISVINVKLVQDYHKLYINYGCDDNKLKMNKLMNYDTYQLLNVINIQASGDNYHRLLHLYEPNEYKLEASMMMNIKRHRCVTTLTLLIFLKVCHLK